MTDALYQSWIGAEDPSFETVSTFECGNVQLAVFGGSTASGANHNEDGAFILADTGGGWTFAAVLDGHAGSDSTEAIVRLLESQKTEIASILELRVSEAFRRLKAHLEELLTAPDFIERCQQMSGEAALLLCAEKDGFLWWLSVGDNLLYVLHPEFAQLGQYTVNSRHFYQWIGRANSLGLETPAVTTGVLELRPGPNRILLATDGLVEFGNRQLEAGIDMYKAIKESVSTAGGVAGLMNMVHEAHGRDSATAISWTTDVQRVPLYPSG